MKYRWDIKYLYSGITAFIVLALAILFYSSISKMTAIFHSVANLFSILMPVIYGAVIAYLMNPVVNFLEKKIIFPVIKKFDLIEYKKTKKYVRTFSVFLALALFLLLIYGLLDMLIPQLIDSITTFAIKAPEYTSNFHVWLMKFVNDNPTLEKYITIVGDYFIKFLNDLLPQLKIFLTNLSTGILDVVVVVKNVVIGFIISIYLLNGKEEFIARSKKVLYALFKPRKANKILNGARFVHKKFIGFIVGQIIDAILVGIICYIVTSIMHTPYNVLISVIIGVTNVIPFLGPYIGAVPSALLILLVNPIQAVYFVIFIIILQTFDGNVLAPRILSESTDLSSFWIVFAILLMGGLFGIVGMFIGVPVFAVIYAAISNYINRLLYLRRMPTDSVEYFKLDHIELERGAQKYGEFIYMQDEEDSESKNKVSRNRKIFNKKIKIKDYFKAMVSSENMSDNNLSDETDDKNDIKDDKTNY